MNLQNIGKLEQYIESSKIKNIQENISLHLTENVYYLVQNDQIMVRCSTSDFDQDTLKIDSILLSNSICTDNDVNYWTKWMLFAIKQHIVKLLIIPKNFIYDDISNDFFLGIFEFDDYFYKLLKLDRYDGYFLDPFGEVFVWIDYFSDED